MSIETMRQALEALENHMEQTRPINMTQNAIHALRQAIEQAGKQEPVAYKYTDKSNPLVFYFTELKGKDVTQNLDVIETALYTAPPKREWVGLTDDEGDWILGWAYAHDTELVKTVEAKLKERNT